jgi:hypothetical protein
MRNKRLAGPHFDLDGRVTGLKSFANSIEPSECDIVPLGKRILISHGDISLW